MYGTMIPPHRAIPDSIAVRRDGGSSKDVDNKIRRPSHIFVECPVGNGSLVMCPEYLKRAFFSGVNVW